MPLILAIGAGYAYYKRKNGVDIDNNGVMSKKITKIDPAIKLKGKTALSLHMFEKEMCMLELPITTVTFYDGNYEHITLSLKNQIELIIQRNPWLMGRLLPMPDLKIIYDPIGVDRPPSYFTIYEPSCVLLSDTTPYNCYSSILKHVMVLPNSELLGQNMPLWKVSLIPNETEPTKKFAMVVSMSHLMGDAHTYYTIYNMLSVESSQNVEALNPVRMPDYVESVRQFLGESETNFVNELLSTKNLPFVDETMTTTSNHVPDQPIDARLSKENKGAAEITDGSTEVLCRQLDCSISAISDTSEGKVSTNTSRTPCPILDAASSVATTEMDTSFESKSSCATETDYSLRVNPLTLPSVEDLCLLESFVKLKQETSMKKNVVKMFYINEEWIAQQKRAHGSDTISTNSIVSSWFFQVNDASFGLIMMNLRQRLPEVTPFDSGNYVHALVYGENELKNAESIQEKIENLGNMEKNLTQPYLHFDKDKKASISINWTNFNRKELCISEFCQQKFHIPIYNTKVMQYLPEKVSAINLFTISASQCIGSSSSQRQIGAFVVCQEASWKCIEQSGIILEEISCKDS
jgi:hypothetical protein